MTDNPNKGSEAIEKELLNTLRHSNLDKDNLNDLVRIVADLRREGLQRTRILLKGIPRPDAITVQAVVEADRLSNILSHILTKTPRLQGVTVFPYGIPWPEIFHVNVDVGHTTQPALGAGMGVAA